jgi:glycosyltransferase involved in cell wall biosynthesis
MASVMEQSFNDFEYIVIDGFSTDGSVEVIKSNQKNIHYWISEEDSGIYNAMNKGIKVAKGDYILFLNSGDVLTGPTALSDFINHPGFEGDIIYGDYKFETGEKIYPDVLPPNYFMKTSLPHQSTFFKKSVFNLMGNYDEGYRIGADRAFFIKCFNNKSITFKHLPYFLTLFDLSGVSNDSTYIIKKKEEDQRMLYEFYGSDYDDYLEQRNNEAKRKKAERNSFKGILKRIINRIKKL